MEPAGFNKTAIVTACSPANLFIYGKPYTISYASTVLGPLVVFGTVQINIDPRTGLPILDGLARVTTADYEPTSDQRVTQTTGESPGSLNQRPGTDPNAPGDDDPGLPYNFDEVPRSGPLNGSST
jgi:hypothetical protein